MAGVESVIDALRDALGERTVLVGDAMPERTAWLGGAALGRPAALLRPASTDDVATAMRICHHHEQPVVAQGGLTGLVHGTWANERTIALSLERMNAIEELDAGNRTMTVQAGVPLQMVQERAEDAGLMFPLDLGGRGSATIGGNISTNAGGNRVIRYGMMRENVLGVEAVLADGTVVPAMNRMLKNNAGYDLRHLFVGSEGTLGIVTRAVLRLRQLPRSQNVGFVAVPDYEALMHLLGRVDGALGGTLSAFEVLWREYYQLLTTDTEHRPPIAGDYPYYVLIEALGSDQGADAERFEQALMAALEDGAVADAVVAKSQGERDALWAMRDDVAKNAKHAPIFAFDVSLPIPEIERYVTEVNEALEARFGRYTNMVFGHLGDGNVHVIVGVGDGSSAAREAVEHCVYGPLRPRAGSVSAEHGVGLEKKPYLDWSRSESEIGVMKTLKQAMDPKGILNPGKIFEMGG